MQSTAFLPRNLTRLNLSLMMMMMMEMMRMIRMIRIMRIMRMRRRMMRMGIMMMMKSMAFFPSNLTWLDLSLMMVMRMMMMLETLHLPMTNSETGTKYSMHAGSKL